MKRNYAEITPQIVEMTNKLKEKSTLKYDIIISQGAKTNSLHP